jgi:hypothetical protein
VFANPSDSDMRTLQATALPHMMIMIPQQDEKTGQTHFGSVMYDKKRHGAFKFNKLMRSDKIEREASVPDLPPDSSAMLWPS